MAEVTVTKLEGVFSYVDKDGNVTEMYPKPKKEVLYVESFDAETGVLNTVSDENE